MSDDAEMYKCVTPEHTHSEKSSRKSESLPSCVFPGPHSSDVPPVEHQLPATSSTKLYVGCRS